MSHLRYVFFASLGTAVACGLGAVPFIWLKNIHPKGIGYANAIASSMMIAASFELLYEGLGLAGDPWVNAGSVIGGMLIGLAFILVTHHRAEKHEEVKRSGSTPAGNKTSWKQAFLIIVIMTLHSGAEGMAMGVAQGASTVLGTLVFVVMALQNIPEGLAISSQMVPKGTPRWRAGLRSIATSLPQPLLAVPAFYFVHIFQPLVPWGLGFAAGCMLWMCFGGITKDSYKHTDASWVGVIATLSIIFMVALQVLVQHY